MATKAGAGAAAPDPEVATANGEGQPPGGDRAAAAAALREEAAAQYERDMASAAGTREHAKSLSVSADEMEEGAAATKATALALADRIEAGEG